jgi:hypothetical protein
MSGIFKLGSAGNDAAKFGRETASPVDPITPDREVGPPNADDIPPIVVGTPKVAAAPASVVGAPKVAAAPASVVGAPPIVEEIRETAAIDDREEPAPIDIEGALRVGTAMDAPLFAITLSEVGGLKETDGAENSGMLGIC